MLARWGGALGGGGWDARPAWSSGPKSLGISHSVGHQAWAPCSPPNFPKSAPLSSVLRGKSKHELGKWGFGPPFRGNFCSSPTSVRCGGNSPDWPRKAQIGPGKAPISSEKARCPRPDLLPPPRFSLIIWGLSPHL